MHPKNRHQDRYDLNLLSQTAPELKKFLVEKHNEISIDFSDPDAVIALNRALLLHFYKLKYWDLPQGQLCPPVPGRADYLHYLAELPDLPKGPITVLDVGTGVSLIYPLIGAQEYGWNFVGSDIDEASLKFADNIVKKNELQNKIELRHQSNRENVFKGIIKPTDKFAMTMCNPPFYGSEEEALAENARKAKNLKLQSVKRNFGGSSNELWTPGGEKNFIRKMLFESVDYKNQVQWFTTLVSKGEYLEEFERILKKLGAVSRPVPMEQGQKRSRFLAWRF